LAQLPKVTDPNVLVGHSGADDGCVYKLSDELSVVQTLDFFTPIVDDPYLFGQIAAANAISDVYAMGAKPIFALNILAYPLGTLGPEVLAQILKGGSDKAAEAGIFVVGGHSIDDAEPKYGMAVTGTVHTDKIMANDGAKAGDKLVLTKPLGVGVLTTAVKRGKRTEADIDEAITCMASINRPGGEAIDEVGASTATDVTGYGLGGHMVEVAKASNVGINLNFGAFPQLPGVMDLIAEGCYPGGTKKNWVYFKEWMEYADDITEHEQILTCDAQTSGGLVISVPADKADAMVEACNKHNALCAAVIGEVVAEHPGRVSVSR
jgi:selenide,water dikinase